MMLDPLKFSKLCWPDVTFYKEQKDIIYSVVDNVETVVPAGNMLGKDFVSAFIILWFFLSRYPCKIVTTSVTDKHLSVLWGEINKFIRSSEYPLKLEDGGPLIVNKTKISGVLNGIADPEYYIEQKVSNQQTVASFGGHHVTPVSGRPIDTIPRNLLVGDEVSAMSNSSYNTALPIFKRRLFIGNTWPCQNFFRWSVQGNPATKDPGGDLHSQYSETLLRKLIHIRGEDSPNVKYGQAIVAKYGLKKALAEGLLKNIIPGVLSYQEYMIRRETYSVSEQCVSLDAQWYDGPQEFLYPSDWLAFSADLADKLLGTRRKAEYIGIDTAEGGDNTSMVAIDSYGIVDLVSKKTPDTSIIPGETIAFAKLHGVPASNVYFDLGGGGKEHADLLRKNGFKCHGVRFGASPTPERKLSRKQITDRQEEDETRYTYKNIRAQMYGLLSLVMNPNTGEGFAIPRNQAELRRQLAPIPRQWDGEGRLYLPSKNAKKKDSDEVTMRTLIGCSPDEADALVLAVYGWKLGKRQTGGGPLF
jgi:hypothetical protein